MGFVMKKYIFYFLTIHILYVSMLSCCPFSFSPEDQRPFFEQYDIKTTSDILQTKEKS